MLRQTTVIRLTILALLGISTLAAGCVPDGLWTDIWGYTIIDGTVAAVWNAILGSFGL